MCYRISCPVLDCPIHMHRKQPGKCCPECEFRINNTKLTASGKVPYREKLAYEIVNNQSGCIFREQNYASGENFRLDACTLCSCLSGGIICRRLRCPKFGCIYDSFVYRDSAICCPFCQKIEPTTIAIRPKANRECVQLFPNGTVSTKKASFI